MKARFQRKLLTTKLGLSSNKGRFKIMILLILKQEIISISKNMNLKEKEMKRQIRNLDLKKKILSPKGKAN